MPTPPFRLISLISDACLLLPVYLGFLPRRESPLRRKDPPLISALCDCGLGRPDPIELGLQTGGSAALLGSSGARSERIFVIGPILKGELWETTAVRELREQAADLASHMASILEHSPRAAFSGPGRHLAWGTGNRPRMDMKKPRMDMGKIGHG
jgi:hypothetical protein